MSGTRHGRPRHPARRVEFTGGPHLIHRHEPGEEEWMAFFTDPDGQPLAIMSQAPASVASDRP